MKPLGGLSQDCWALGLGTCPRPWNSKGRAGVMSLCPQPSTGPVSTRSVWPWLPASLPNLRPHRRPQRACSLSARGGGRGFRLYNVWGRRLGFGISQRRLPYRLPPILPTPNPAGRAHLPLPSFSPCGRHHAAWRPWPSIQG